MLLRQHRLAASQHRRTCPDCVRERGMHVPHTPVTAARTASRLHSSCASACAANLRGLTACRCTRGTTSPAVAGRSGTPGTPKPRVPVLAAVGGERQQSMRRQTLLLPAWMCAISAAAVPTSSSCNRQPPQCSGST